MKEATSIISLISFVLIASVMDCLVGQTSARAGPYPVTHVRYSFTLHNTTSRTLQGVHFWTYAPVKETSTQQCRELHASHPYRLISDALGNQILHFSFTRIPPYATRIITIDARLIFTGEARPAKVMDVRPYLIPEKYVETDDSEIVKVASSIKKGTPLQMAERTYWWVSGHIRDYDYSGADRGALYALRNRKGDCSEAMHLFIALCRANGIPARGVGGYVYGGSAVLEPNAYHNWGEFYAAGAWHVADPQRQVFVSNHYHYIAMRIIGKNHGNPMEDHSRFFFIGEGLEVRMGSPAQKRE